MTNICKKFLPSRGFLNLLLVYLTLICQSFSSTERPESFQEDLYCKYFKPQRTEAWVDFCRQKKGVTDVTTEPELIISLTSYPARMATTWLAIESLLRQTHQPNRIVLVLSEEEYPQREIHPLIQMQTKRGVEILWNSGNLKSFKKLIPTVQKYPEATIVAVDDDQIYPNSLIKDLVQGSRKHPSCIIGRDVRIPHIIDNIISPVSNWHLSGLHILDLGREIPPTVNLMPEGIGGILFPPHCFHSDLPKKEIFFDLCPTDDDAWHYTMAILKGIKIAKIGRLETRVDLEHTQEIQTALWKTNSQDNCLPLSIAFKKLFDYYNLGPLLGASKVLIRFEDSSHESWAFYHRQLTELYDRHRLLGPLFGPLETVMRSEPLQGMISTTAKIIERKEQAEDLIATVSSFFERFQLRSALK